MSFHLASTQNYRKNFEFIFLGIFSGAVICAVIGLLDFSGVISLKWYRLGTTHIPGVLHSTFLNRGLVFGIYPVGGPFCFGGFYRPNPISLVENNSVCSPDNLRGRPDPVRRQGGLGFISSGPFCLLALFLFFKGRRY